MSQWYFNFNWMHLKVAKVLARPCCLEIFGPRPRRFVISGIGVCVVVNTLVLKQFSEEWNLLYFSYPNPPVKPLPFESSIPESWFPIDRDHDYELVALDPAKLEYHLVASAFHETLPSTKANITDVFRVQNAFLWHKYVRSASYSILSYFVVWCKYTTGNYYEWRV